jgi:ABC-type multidrug transport system fused ATPase/permease subunit
MEKMSTFAKIQEILSPAERRGGGVLLALMIVGMLLETLGIGLVIPAISIMMKGDVVSRYPAISSAINLFGNPSQKELIVAAMLGLVAIYLVKNVFLAFLAWRQTHFAFDVQEKLSQRLFALYLQQPYTFHLQRNSAQLVRNVTGEVSLFTMALISGLSLVAEMLVLFGIIFLLLVVEPLGTMIIALVLGGTALGFHRLTSSRIVRWGMERQHHDGLRIQHIQQGLGGVKDVKLLGREREFLEEFSKHNIKSARAWKLQTTLQTIPRQLFELLAVTGLAVLVISMLSQGRDMESLIPTLGLFAVAAFRLMPSINKVLGSAQALKYSLPVVSTLFEESKLQSSDLLSRATNHLMKFQEIRLVNVVYQYPTATAPSVDGISITIRKGEFVGLIGSSGAGKSTLVDLILGLLTPSAGKIEVDGYDIQLGLRLWQDQIGYVPQSIYLTDDTLRRNVAFGIPDEQIDDLAVQRAVKAAQLEEFVSALPEGLSTIVGERGVRLSGGQRQRIGIARAIYHDPAVLVLDEATSALDNATESEVMQAVMALRGSKIIIAVAHRLSTVAECDRLFSLEKGRIVVSSDS